MLINTPLKHGEVVTLKLVSSEEIVANFDNDNGTEISVTKPMTLVAQKDSLGLAPYLFTIASDEKVSFNKTAIICINRTEKDNALAYTNQTSTIQL